MVNKTKAFKINKRYLMIPQCYEAIRFRRRTTWLQQSADAEADSSLSGSKEDGHPEVTVTVDGRPLFSQKLAIRGNKPWWWTGLDLSPWQGKTPSA